jgi:hypothetical protein
LLTEEEMKDQEASWSAELSSSSTSLVIQVEYDDGIALTTFNHLGQYLKNNEAFIHLNYPASFLIGLNCVTSRELRDATLWPAIFSALGIADTQSARQKISALHEFFLDKFGLARFDHPLTQIGEIQLHAGIPVHSQSKFISKLIRAYSESADLNGESFNAVIRSISRDDVPAKMLDMPIWRFIVSAGDVADDFVAKCIDLLDDLQDDGIRNSDGGAGLPARVIDEIERIVKLGGKLTRHKSSGIRIASPKLHWDEIATDNELHLELPYLADKLRMLVKWQFDDQTETQSQTTYPPLVVGSQNEPDFFMVKTITPQIYVEAQTSDLSSQLNRNPNWSIKLYTPENTLLVFDENGMFVESTKSRLSPAIYTFLYPQESSTGLNRLVVKGETQSTELDSPNGWEGWVAQKIDLSSAKSVAIWSGDKENSTSKRIVSTVRRPKLIFEAVEIPDVFNVYGQHVYSGLPSVEIPLGLDQTTTWVVSVRNRDRQLVWRHEFSTSDSLVDLETLSPPEFDGIFELVIEKPGSLESLRLEICLVSNLESHSSAKARRLLRAGGLEDFETLVSRGSESQRVVLGTMERATTITNQGLSVLELLIKPQYESVELFNKSSGRRSEWITSARSHIEDLVDLELSYKSFEVANKVLVAKWSNGHSVVLSPSATSNRHRYSLSQLTGDAAVHGAFDLILSDYSGEFPYVAAKCYEKRILSSLKFGSSDGSLSFDFGGKSVPSDLKMAIYPAGAPWREHSEFAVTDLTLELPHSITRFGRLYAAFAISDVWAPHQFPPIPEYGDNNYILEFEPDLDLGNPEDALVHWLITDERADAVYGINTALAWSCYLNPELSARFASGAKVKQHALQVLQANPLETLREIPVAHSLPDNYLSLAFKAGLVTMPAVSALDRIESFTSKPFLSALQAKATNPEEKSVVRNWARQSLGLMIAGSVTIDGEIQEVTFERTIQSKSELLSYVVPQTGSINPFVAQFTDQDLDEFGEMNALVPGRLFDRGSIFAIFAHILKDAMSLAGTFKVGQLDNHLRAISEQTQSAPNEFVEISKTRPETSESNLEAFRKIGGARSNLIHLPALSIRLALVARLVARGDTTAKHIWDDFKLIFQDISVRCPELVERDLVLAELYLSFTEGTDNGND